MNRKNQRYVCWEGIDGWAAEGQLGKCWGRLTKQDTLRIAPPWLFGSSVPVLIQLQLLLHSALASEARTHLLTMGRALLPCAAKAGQEMGNAHLQSLITHNARLCMGVRGPQSTTVQVILCHFELEVYMKSRGLSACPWACRSWSSLTAFYGSLISEVKWLISVLLLCFFFACFVLFFQSVYNHGFKITI